MTLMSGSRSARPTAASISSGIGGTMVLSCSGRFSVMVAPGPAVVYRRGSKTVVGIAQAKSVSSPVSSIRATRGRLTSVLSVPLGIPLLEVRLQPVKPHRKEGADHRQRAYQHRVHLDPPSVPYRRVSVKIKVHLRLITPKIIRGVSPNLYEK